MYMHNNRRQLKHKQQQQEELQKQQQAQQRQQLIKLHKRQQNNLEKAAKVKAKSTTRTLPAFRNLNARLLFTQKCQNPQQYLKPFSTLSHQTYHRPPPLNSELALIILTYMLLIVVSLPASSHADWLMDCGDCHCKWNSGKKTADCKNLSLAGVPENLSPEVQVLDLSLNRILYLEQNAFLTADLQNLHKLYIRNSSLQQIDPRSFTQLEILIELDLSNNLLRALQANLFVRLVKVRALVLNGNLLESLGDGVFQNLKYLHKVELKSNRLVRIAPQAFMNVPLLTQIYLDGNRLNFLRKESFENLKRLTALSLDQNPWNCTCELQIFRDFVLRRNLYTPPTACYYPAHLRGMLWVEDQPEAFACKPRIIYPSRGASISTSKENVTLVCRVHASPNTLIAWDYNKQMYRANAAASTAGLGLVSGINQRVHIQLLRDEQSKEKEFGRDVFISRLTILGAEKSDEGIYTCLAENAGGKDAVQMSLLVQKPGPKDLLLQSNLFIVICLMALGLLSVSVFFAMVTCCIYKRFKQLSPAHHRHHLHRLNVNDQLSGGVNQTTTTVSADTDVVLGVSVDETALGNYKHHLQKANQNGGSGGRNSSVDKYAEVIKHGATVLENGQLTRDGQPAQLLSHAEKTYLERSSEDTLHIRYPHGLAAQVDISQHTLSNNSLNSSGSSKTHNSRHIEMSGSSELPVGRTGEYQPDLLPAYNNKTGSNQQAQLYSPIKSTRTITPQPVDHQQQLQQQRQLPRPTSPATKTKYNSSTQEYLQSRYNSTITKLTKREAPGLPLTSSASLSAAGYTSTAGGGIISAQESRFSTQQRHSKSLALPPRNPSTTISTPTPTDNSYEYRQPPPPPYNAAHRTASGLLPQRRTSGNDDHETNNAATKDQGYRDAKTSELGAALNATRQTIVTASPSLNFLKTTGYTPRQPLL